MAPGNFARHSRVVCSVVVLATLAGCSGFAPSTPRTTTTTTPRSTTTAPTGSSTVPTTTAPTNPTTTAPGSSTTTTAPPGVPLPGGALCSAVKLRAAANPARFSASTTWNQPVACMNTRADSPRWATNWFNNANLPGRTNPAEKGAINVSFDTYSSPVYSTEDATTTVRVFTASWGYPHNLGSDNSVPWNPAWEPAPGNDMEMIITDPDTGREWGLWGVQKLNWSSCITLENILLGWRPGIDLCVAQALVGKNPDGTYADDRVSSGFAQQAGRGMGSILMMALLPTLDEIEKGSINHALNMETYGTMFGPACTTGQMGTAAAGVDCGFAVAPATRLEFHGGPTVDCGSQGQQNTPADRAKTVPEGMRFALNMTDQQIDAWLDSRGYTGAKRSTARIFAVALRDYGWIISDTTCWDSSIATDGVANPKSRLRWQALGITNPTTDGTTLLDGLITSEQQVRAVESPSPAFVVATH